ncbi:hypothetical protein L6164_036338 [Bauhinia variegata]|uniref:Uncharacterized protein n=1 Tax=Bauhinia variegata TaxID=167791 RepID=A0ACB9KGV3_BAUVA|nr:hypothetical protein L6164_036338 [Bauhinia variegata]
MQTVVPLSRPCQAFMAHFPSNLKLGPLAFNLTDYSGGLPQLILTPYTWTKTASIIFIDAPVGTGFSYATNSEGYQLSDSISAWQTHKFLRKLNNLTLNAGNAAGLKLFINLIGFLSGSPHTNAGNEVSARVPYAQNMALISDKLYMEAKQSCNGRYVDVDSSNKVKLKRVLKKAGHFLYLSQKPRPQDWWCKNFEYLLLDVWANKKTVQEALLVREGTIQRWSRCNLTLINTYDRDITDAYPYQKNLTETGLQVLLYTGDHDMVVPHIATEEWLASLNITTDFSWRPLFVDGQVAGYQVVYSTTSGYRLTYATVKGSGHSPTEDDAFKCLKDESCFTNGYLDIIVDWIPSMKDIRLKDFPRHTRTTDPNDLSLDFMIQEICSAHRASAIVSNTFDEFEGETLNALSSIYTSLSLYTVGLLSSFLNQGPQHQLASLGFSLWKEETKCLEWLETKDSGSVPYVNFGSSIVMSSEQLFEFAWGLAESKKPFL